ncbi:MAG: HIT family protein [Candidatus Nanohaloarchaea archaeon]|nr:HIT family protein [Candidatus Nanohaloarchaea archaeon]
MNDDCIFCQIINDKIEANTVHEDDQTQAFLDLNPVSHGHTLIIPKTHAEELRDLDQEYTGALFNTARKIAAAIDDQLGPAGINLLQSNGEAAGQEIRHVHVHVIPRYDGDGFDIDMEQGSLEQPDDLIQQIQQGL